MQLKHRPGYNRDMLVDPDGRVVAFIDRMMDGVYLKDPMLETIIGVFESSDAAQLWAEKNIK